jgi:uroporphyrinogen decarboxylase
MVDTRAEFSSKKMTHWERFMAAARGQTVDQVPVALIGTARYFSYMAGCDVFDFYYDPNVMIEAQKKTFDRFPEVTFIPGCWPDYGAGWLTAMGLRVEWPLKDTCGSRDHRCKTLESIRELPIPNPKRDGMWPWHLRTLRSFRERADEFADRLHCLHCIGPGELGTYLHGITETMEAFILDPELADKLFERSTDIIIRWLEAQLEVLPDAQAALLTDDIAGFSSDEHYRQLLLPHHQRIRKAFPELLFIFHNDTASDHVLHSIEETGFEVFQLGQATSLQCAKDAIGKNMALMGNLDAVNILSAGTLAEVEKEAFKCLETAAPGGGFILAPGGGMNPGIAPEKIDMLVECSRQYADSNRC